MTRALLAAAATVALILTGTVPAGASARACSNECVSGKWDFGGTGTASWFEAKWTINNGGWYERGFIHCQNGRSYELGTGGWVTSLNLYSKATCNAGYVGVGGGYDSKTCASCSITRHWITGRRKA